MHVLNTTQDLLENLPGILLTHGSILGKVVCQLNARDQLNNLVNGVVEVVLENLLSSHNILVIQMT